MQVNYSAPWFGIYDLQRLGHHSGNESMNSITFKEYKFGQMKDKLILVFNNYGISRQCSNHAIIRPFERFEESKLQRIILSYFINKHFLPEQFNGPFTYW